MRASLTAVLMMSAVAACSHENDKGAAYHECVDYMETVCQKKFSCAVELGEAPRGSTDKAVDDCVDEALRAIKCENAARTTSNYDECLAAFQTLSCDPWFYDALDGDASSTPSSCRGIFVLE